MTDLDEARGALELYDEDGFLDSNDLQRVMPVVRWALNLVANGERVEPDYEAAFRVMYPDMHLEGSETTEFDESWCRSIVDAAVGGRLLVDPPKEEER